MEIQQARPAYIPRSLQAELLADVGDGKGTPGFIMDAQSLMSQNQALRHAITGSRDKAGLSGAPCIVVPPKEMSAIFAYDKDLDLLRSIADLLVEQLHPHTKTGIDVVWLVYRAFKLREEWLQPNRDTVSCLLKLADITLGAAGVTGRLYPEMKLSDPWANGLNFVVKNGQELREGKTLPLNELVLSTEQRLEIPLKIFKVAGISLDPTEPVPIPRPLITPLTQSNVGVVR